MLFIYLGLALVPFEVSDEYRLVLPRWLSLCIFLICYNAALYNLNFV